MTCFLTAAKVDQQLLAVINELEYLKPCIDKWRSKVSFALSSGLGAIEMAELINGLSHVQAESYVTLENARIKLSKGNLIPRHGGKIIKVYKSLTKKVRWHLDRLDASDAAGKAAFEKFQSAGYRH